MWILNERNELFKYYNKIIIACSDKKLNLELLLVNTVFFNLSVWRHEKIKMKFVNVIDQNIRQTFYTINSD